MSACQADAATGTQPDGPDALRGEMVAREVRTGYSRCEGAALCQDLIQSVWDTAAGAHCSGLRAGRQQPCGRGSAGC
jgi:hypothetical protein